MTARTITCVLLLCISACGGAPERSSRVAPAKARLSPGPLRTAAALAHEFQWQQRVTAHYPTGSSSFEAVLLHRDGALTLVGLSPMGLPGFVITLSADAKVEMDNRSGQSLPFEPSYILADVQRVFFPWLQTPAPGFNGLRSGALLGVQVTETFDNGTLVRRAFLRDDAPEKGQVVIRYEGWSRGSDAPARVVLDNEWFGYELVIETVSQTRL